MYPVPSEGKCTTTVQSQGFLLLVIDSLNRALIGKCMFAVNQVLRILL